VIAYGAEWWSTAEPGMPLITSLSLIRPSSRCTRSSAMPNQLARIPICSTGWARIAVVHSTVWIFAMSAAITRRALSKTWSSLHDGYAACTTSQTALCSRMNAVCSSSSPIHQPSRPPELPSSAGSTSIRPSAPIATFPGPRSGLRIARWNSTVLP
jgi:hypothetical protein